MDGVGLMTSRVILDVVDIMLGKVGTLDLDLSSAEAIKFVRRCGGDIELNDIGPKVTAADDVAELDRGGVEWCGECGVGFDDGLEQCPRCAAFNALDLARNDLAIQVTRFTDSGQRSVATALTEIWQRVNDAVDRLAR